MDLKNKKAFVAGSSKGIGYAVAETFARLGASVFMAARDEDLLRKRSRELASKQGVETAFCSADLSSERGVETAVASGMKAFGGFDILVANCGGPKAGTAMETMDESSLNEAYEKTFMSSVRLIRGLLPQMMERKSGRIIAITSVSVFEPIESLALSNAFRTGLTAYLKSLAGEVAPLGITVNAVCPGYTRTERLGELSGSLSKKSGLPAAEIIGGWEKSVPMKRLGEPAEIAAAVAFLASDEASYITGISLPVDGGRLKGVFV